MTAEEAKQKGNAAYAAGRYEEAIACFTEAIGMNTEDTPLLHVYHSNRSAAYLMVGDAVNALRDAEECISLKSEWSKGYSRKGAALFRLGRFEDAALVYEAGLLRDPENAACKQGRQDALKAKSSYSTSSMQGVSFKNFLWGSSMARIRSFQGLLRIVAIVHFVLYLLPLGQPSVFYQVVYARFFKVCAVNYLCCLGWTHGRPQWNQMYAVRIAQDATTHSLLYCILMWATEPYCITMLPILMHEVLHVSWLLTCVGKCINTSLFGHMGSFFDPYVGKFVGHPHWEQLTSDAKWKVLNRRIPELSSLLTVLVGVSFLIELLTPNRNFMRTFLYWQYLRVVYMLSSTVQQAFVTLDGTMLSMVRHPNCPSMLTRTYEALKRFLASMSQMPQPGQANGGAASRRCTIS